MGETYAVYLHLENDGVDWEVFGVDKGGLFESLHRGSSFVYSDALFEAGVILRPFMPEELQ
jgi:hypothetical protein